MNFVRKLQRTAPAMGKPTIFASGKIAAGAGPHDCRTRQPRKKFHHEEPASAQSACRPGFLVPNSNLNSI
jgi:hypothetical protein